MYWNDLGECLAKDHPNYNHENCCLDCEAVIKPEEMIVHFIYKHLEGAIQIGPIVGHAKCFPKRMKGELK